LPFPDIFDPGDRPTHNFFNCLIGFFISQDSDRAGHHAIRMSIRLFENLTFNLLEQVLRLLIIQSLKSRLNTRFDRETSQDTFTKGMNSLNLQTFGRFKGFGKQTARIIKELFFTFFFGIKKRVELLGQFRFGHDTPFAQCFEQTVLHLIGSRLGISQAKDFIRRRTPQQKTCYPIDQNFCLAGPGIGRCQPGAFRLGGFGLGPVRACHILTHYSPPLPLLPFPSLAHSARRAKRS